MWLQTEPELWICTAGWWWLFLGGRVAVGRGLLARQRLVSDPVPICLLPGQVVDVAKLMKAYISMIVKKRYSTSRSVSSQGSSR